MRGHNNCLNFKNIKKNPRIYLIIISCYLYFLFFVNMPLYTKSIGVGRFRIYIYIFFFLGGGGGGQGLEYWWRGAK